MQTTPPIQEYQSPAFANLENRDPAYWSVIRWAIAAWATMLICRHGSYWLYQFSIGVGGSMATNLALTGLEVLVAIIILIGALLPHGRPVVFVGAILMILAVFINIAGISIMTFNQRSGSGPFGKTNVQMSFALWQFFSALVSASTQTILILLASMKR